MSRKSSRRDGGNGFLRKLAWTVLLALVFSAGLITGQRMIRSETRAPLVSVTSKSKAPTADDGSSTGESDESKKEKEPLFSFYDRLSEGGDSPEPEAAGEQEPSEDDDNQNDEGSSSADEQAADPADDASRDDSNQEQAGEATESTPGDSPSAAPDSEKSAAAKYTLQVSAYSSMDRARSRIRKLSDKGLDAHVVSAEVPEKGTYYRVRIGKFGSMEKAEKFQAEIERKRGVDTFVTPL